MISSFKYIVVSHDTMDNDFGGWSGHNNMADALDVRHHISDPEATIYRVNALKSGPIILEPIDGA